MSSDSVPSNDLVEPADPGNNATFYKRNGDNTIGNPYWRTEVGAHENSESPYGTFDQGGNVWEWYETRWLRGGSFYKDLGAGSCFPCLSAEHRFEYHPPPTSVNNAIGFRVGFVPEPGTLALLAFGTAAVLGRRRR